MHQIEIFIRLLKYKWKFFTNMIFDLIREEDIPVNHEFIYEFKKQT